MSSSDKKDAPDAQSPENTDPSRQNRPWGRVFIGLTETNLAGVEAARDAHWSEKDEADYLERVKSKAQAKAKEILEAAAAEGGAIRAQAREEGYAKGLEDAQAELDEFRAGMADSVAAVLSAIEGQCSGIFDAWRTDLVEVLRLAVEKAVGIALGEERGAALEAVYVKAVQALAGRDNLVVKVNPEDEAVVADIIALTQARHQDITNWQVKADPTITPGGMVVESSSSLADSRVESRLAAVQEALAHLNLPAERP